MEKLIKVYLKLLNHIQKKLLLREFHLFKSSLPIKKLNKTAPVFENNNKRLARANTFCKSGKFKSLNDAGFAKLLQEPQEDIMSNSNIFEELKSSLQNTALKSDVKLLRSLDKNNTVKVLHKKNTLSYASSGAYTNKGTRKNLVQATPDMLNNLAVVSSSSALSFRKDKNTSLFMLISK